MIDLVVTRHPALVAYLRARGIIADDTPIVSRATVDDVRGRHVLGVVPLRLSAWCHRVTEVTLAQGIEGIDEYSVCRVADVAPIVLDAMETSRLGGWRFRAAELTCG
jgi:hypothetical protein